jgi:hypothetical protein
MELYLTVTDKSVTAVDLNRDLVLTSNNDQIINAYFIDDDGCGLVITGATVYLTIKNLPTDTDANAVLKKTYTSSTFPNASAGEVAITLTKADTASLRGSYLYSIDIKFSDNTIKTASEGVVTFKRDLRQTF